MNLMSLFAVIGSFGSGITLDRAFKGHRSPVAMVLRFLETAVVLVTAFVLSTGLAGPMPAGIFIGCVFLVLIAFAANSTHSVIGTAAPMDIGGRKMAGFASGVVDSFQYYGSAVALPLTGWLLDRYGWGVWYPVMAGFGAVGGCAMLLVMRKQRRMTAAAGGGA